MSSELPARPKARRTPVQRPRQPLATAARHVTPQSLRDLAYEAIKYRIITCAFKPGEYVNEARVAAVLGLGRTPVHQAIDRLMLDGMVEVIPRKGVIVKPVSLDEVMQIIEARLIVEPQGVRMTAARADETDIAALSDILGRARQWTAVRNVEQMMLLDREFHLVLARAGRNDVFADILRKLHERSLRFWFISLTDAGHHGAVQEEHGAILQAIRDRDLDAAEAAMRNHIESFRKNVARYL
jgi:DNA-binding GntR family transcriptional regulator